MVDTSGGLFRSWGFGHELDQTRVVGAADVARASDTADSPAAPPSGSGKPGLSGGAGSGMASGLDASVKEGVCHWQLISSAQRLSSGTDWKTSFNVTVIGIASTRPTSPHRKPQNRQAISTVVPLRSSD